MDFASPLLELESTASRSNIKTLPIPISTTCTATGDGRNKAVKDDAELDGMVVRAANQAAQELLENKYSLVDSSAYTERVLPLQGTIQPGDLVVILESFNQLNFCYVKPGEIFNNRNGHFHHSDFVNKPFGSKIRSRNQLGFVYVLKPTPELWTRSLNHRTQIVHELDQAQIIWNLELRPNMVVIESGTGSGAMSHAILRTIAPHGHLHTYEFNEMRARTAVQEFEQHGVQHLVTVHHRDVCQDGFDLPQHSVDAVFLDLPEPWSAIPHLAQNNIVKPTGRIATYSPCVEQTQRTVQMLRQHNFHSIQTFEYRLQEHYVDAVEYEPPPMEARPRQVDLRYNQNKEDEDFQNDAMNTDNEDTAKSVPLGVQPTQQRKRHLVARPFVMMRGHTAFLTFATVGITQDS